MNEATSRLSYNTRYFSGACPPTLAACGWLASREAARVARGLARLRPRLRVCPLGPPPRTGNYLVIVAVLAVYALSVSPPSLSTSRMPRR